MTFKKPTDKELFRLVEIQDEQSKLKRRLLKRIGLWRYIKYSLNPLKFAKNLDK